MMNNNGHIYFLINRLMPSILKIGYTTRKLEERITELETTGVPYPFIIGASFYVKNPHKCEIELHALFKEKRVTDKREFFQCSLLDALEKAIPIIMPYVVIESDSQRIELESTKENGYIPDEDDVYFMQFILHDGYSEKRGISTQVLSKHHTKYHPLELEIKLNNLYDNGFLVKLKRNRSSMLSDWLLSDFGMKYMFEHKHILKDLIEEEKITFLKNNKNGLFNSI